MMIRTRLAPFTLALLLTPTGCSQSRLGHPGAPDGAATGGDDDASGGSATDARFVLPDVSDGRAPDSAAETTAVLDCSTVAKTPGNAGCSFFAAQPPLYKHACYAMFVVNPGTRPAKLTLSRGATTFPLAHVARVPRGGGNALTYEPFDEAAGLAPGDVAVLFLSGTANPSTRPSSTPSIPIPGLPPVIPVGLQTAYCPHGVETASTDSTEAGRGGNVQKPTWSSATGQAFHLTSDLPVVAYDIAPYGGADSALTSASLLLGQESWGTSHVAATPVYQSVGAGDGNNTPPYLFVVAGEDGTDVSIKPTAPISAGTGIPAAAAGQVVHVHLDAGQYAQVVETDTGPSMVTPGLSGTLVGSNKPVGLVGGTACFQMDASTQACDSAHQQIPPFGALGHEYAAVRYRSRVPNYEEPVPWQIVGAVDGTVLTYAPRAPTPYAMYATPAPTTLAAGQSVEFWTTDPFVVRSQDAAHPFYVAGYMTGTDFLSHAPGLHDNGAGDPEFVNVVPTDQYRKDYTFFTDPTYPETSLVVVRQPGPDGHFADVKLACASAPLFGWTPLGSYEYTRVDLVSGLFQPLIAGCDNGRQQMSSSAPFAVTVWGWGNKQVNGTTYVSYAYPAGAALATVNQAKPPVIE